MSKVELKDFLDSMVDRYNRPDFIEHDPISIPHGYSRKEDIEIIAFLVATISWGNRKSIISSAQKIEEIVERAPYEFITAHSENDLKRTVNFVHRTFNGDDLLGFIVGLRRVYEDYGSLEMAFAKWYSSSHDLATTISAFRRDFFQAPHLARTEKHVSDPMKGSAAKRIHMFLRWMVRKDDRGVDFGIWNQIPMSVLSCPLDVHTGNVARELGMLTRKQNDLKAVRELDLVLRDLDIADPVRYDFALFGWGEERKRKSGI
ncbi:MAG: TIGR02757 family protein [Flavobacteriales bacterium]|nr:TIGR02757 family protein [Flavobacteriales bacterium]